MSPGPPRSESEIDAEVERQCEALSRGTEEIVPPDEFRARVRESIQKGRPLRVKQGFDPTAPDIHLGHTIGLRKLRQFQELGHTVVLIIGDYTGMIGDPTDRSETRPRLTHDQVSANAETYLRQFFKVVRRERTEVHRNGEWFSKMDFQAVMELGASYTVARLLERDDFARRFRDGVPISIHELFYPLMQGYDSVQIRPDVEIGATEQKFNILVGRQLMKDRGMPPQIALTLPVLEGTDGVRRMSKSLGNTIGIDEPPAQMYGKTMSIPDVLVMRYLELVTDVVPAEIAALGERMPDDPMAVKRRLATELVVMYHGAEAARAAAEEFERVFSRRDGLPEGIPEFSIALDSASIWIVRLLRDVGLAATNSEARRLVRSGGITLDGERVTDENLEVPVDPPRSVVLRKGKLGFARVRLSSRAS
jgi:tyrosyl-tRNA synthetase